MVNRQADSGQTALASLPENKLLVLDRRYSFPMMTTVLLRIISKLIPDQTQLLLDRTTYRFAVLLLLLKMDNRTDKLTVSSDSQQGGEQTS